MKPLKSSRQTETANRGCLQCLVRPRPDTVLIDDDCMYRIVPNNDSAGKSLNLFSWDGCGWAFMDNIGDASADLRIKRAMYVWERPHKWPNEKS